MQYVYVNEPRSIFDTAFSVSLRYNILPVEAFAGSNGNQHMLMKEPKTMGFSQILKVLDSDHKRFYR